MTNMNIVPKVKLSIDELLTKAKDTNKGKVYSNTSIESINKQVKQHLCIK